VVTANNQSVAAGQHVALSSLFSVSGSGITQYKVWFSYPEGGAPAVGTLTSNGAPIALDQWVTLNSLSGLVYTGSASSGTDKIWLMAYNGQWSEALANVTDPGAPAPVVTANDQSVAAGQQVALSNLFSVSGSGITQYKVWFSYPEGGAPAVGTLTSNGTPIALDQWVTLNSLSGLVYTGSASSGTDKIWLMAYNGQWSEALANVTDPGLITSANHSSDSQLSGLGSEHGGLDQTVALLNQYMAASLGQSDFGGTNHLNVAFQDQSPFLTPPAQDRSHHG
jgi:phosphohistidine swiveling domain-containing protein